MIDGFWIVQFEGLQAKGGGVAVLRNGHIFGGDSGFTYTGTYETDEKVLKARVMIRKFLPDVQSIFGIEDEYELSLAGTVEDNVIKGKAVVIGRPGLGTLVRLTKRGNVL